MYRGCGLVFAAGLVAAGCQFNEGGLPGAFQPGVDGGRAAVDGAPAADASPNAPIDAPPEPCLDSDMDGFMIVNVDGATCGPELDCDDAEPNAFPGQIDFFDVPAASGGFDYDCNGVEEPQDTTQGGTCESDWWECIGSGWNGDVPACGVEGTWHTCEDVNGCTETSSFATRMPCR